MPDWIKDLAEFLADAGVTVASIVFAAIGAALGVAYSPELTRREALSALFSGIVIGTLLPELIALVPLFKGMPGIAKNAMCVTFGIGGMFIVPGVMRAWSQFRADPWGFIADLRALIGGTPKSPGDKP